MKGFQFAIWPNKYKKEGSRQPDARGHVAFPISVLKELSQAYQKGELPVEADERNGGIEVVKLEASAWRNDPDGNKPVISAEIKSWSEMAARAAEKAAKDAGATNSDDADSWNVPF